MIGRYGCSPELRAGDHRRPLVEQSLQRPQQPRLALTAFAQQHDVVAGDQRALKLGQHGVVETKDAGPHVATLGQRFEKVLADFLLDWTFAMARRAQLTDGARKLVRLGHHSTLLLVQAAGLTA